jgi:2-polyprenyl-6-methoxyphenol hydroxylase-like FAD-dependent oxidoreductase
MSAMFGKPKRAAVIGGSVGGLFAAVLLRQAGWLVDVYDRSATSLIGRGAGITTHPELLEVFAAIGIGLDDLGVRADRRITLGSDGSVVSEMTVPQIHTSWDRIYRLLLDRIPSENYHLDCGFVRADQSDDGVRVRLSTGETVSADLLVGADGFRSAVREQLAPEVQPIYSGYVVWRGTPIESRLAPETIESVFPYFAFYFPKAQQVMGYPIAGLDNDLRPGFRRYNWIWYRVVDDAKLKEMCTDETGRYHEFSIAPPLIRKEVIAEMRKDARNILPPQFLDCLNNIDFPFFTPIYDFISPRMAFGRVALIGDAASVSRPHSGFGVSKAACDAFAMVKALEGADDIGAALKSFEPERIAINGRVVRHGRFLGTALTINSSNREEAKAPQLPVHEHMMRHLAMPNFLHA